MQNKERGLDYLASALKLESCVMWNYANMDALLVAILEVERILVELGEILIELLKEDQEEGFIANKIVEK